MPLTTDKPKPMVEVNGRPFLEYLIRDLKKNGVEEVVVLLGYMHEKITEYFGDGKKFGLSIKYSITPIEDETGTRIRKARELLLDKFLLLYSDNYWPLELQKLCNFYQSHGALASITVYSNNEGITKSNTFVDKTGFVRVYDKSRANPRVNGVEIGFYIFDKKILDLMPKENFSLEAELLPKLISINQLAGYLTPNRHYSITSPNKIPAVAEYLSKLV